MGTKLLYLLLGDSTLEPVNSVFLCVTFRTLTSECWYNSLFLGGKGGKGGEDCQIWRSDQQSLVRQEITQAWARASFIQTYRSTSLVWAPCGLTSSVFLYPSCSLSLCVWLIFCCWIDWNGSMGFSFPIIPYAHMNQKEEQCYWRGSGGCTILQEPYLLY